MSLNKVMLIGNIGSDIRHENNASFFDLATGKGEHTDWHKIAIFNEQLRKIAKDYLKKGSKVYIEGTLQTKKVNDKYYTSVVLGQFNSTLQMLSKTDTQQDIQNFKVKQPDYCDDIPF